MVIRKSVAILAAVLLAVVTSGILYMTQVYPNGSGGDIDTSVNVGSDTKVFWNGKDRTGWTTGAEPYAELPFEELPTMGEPEKFHPPALRLAFAPVNPETMRDGLITSETQFAVFWRAEDKANSCGENGKQLARLSFSGLEEDELISLTPDGVILQVEDTGAPRILHVELKDERGVTTKTDFTLYEQAQV